MLLVPSELSDRTSLKAAFVDGASRIQILRHIIAPLSTPGLVVVGIYAFIGAYAQQFLKNQDTDKKSKDPIDQALRHWTSGPFKQGTDSEDSYHDLAFRGKNPFDDRFRLIAQEIFEPLLNHQKVL